MRMSAATCKKRGIEFARAVFLPLALSGVAFAPAHALSCLPHDVARIYAQAAQSDDTYIIVHGTLTFDESHLPQTDWQNQQKTPPDTLIPARIKGKALTRQGFKAHFNHPITFNVQCLGSWCARAKSGTPYLAVLRKTDGNDQLDINACGGMGFAHPSKQVLGTVERFFQGGPCKPKELPR